MTNSLKYHKIANKYYNSTKTNEVDCNTGTAKSYGWYVYRKIIKGVNVINITNYGTTTDKHIRLARQELGIDKGHPVMFVGCARASLDRPEQIIELLQRKIDELKGLINKKGTKQAKNEERAKEIAELYQQIVFFKNL